MRRLIGNLILSLAVAAGAGGCSVLAWHKPHVQSDRLGDVAKIRVAVLPFDNLSREPLAAGAARDALYYALADRGFVMIPYPEIDRIMGDPLSRARLYRPDGRADPQAAGAILGADALVIGRVDRAREIDLGPLVLARLQMVFLMTHTRTLDVLWHDQVSALVWLPDLPRRADSPAMPARGRQYEAVLLAEGFDYLWQWLALGLPGAAISAEAPAIHQVLPRTGSLIVPAGEQIAITVVGAPSSSATAQLGTMGKVVGLEEMTNAEMYRGAYRVEEGDYSNYCRVIGRLRQGGLARRKAAGPHTGFIIDTIAPDAPTSLAYSTRPGLAVLTWAGPAAPDIAYYMIYRALPNGGVRLLGRPVANEFIDDTVRGPGRFTYFVKAIDLAENPSSSSMELPVDLPAPGPSAVGGTIQGTVRWAAYGTPYRLTKSIEVARDAQLIIEPGTRIEIPAGMEITVRGTVEALGTTAYPIEVAGPMAEHGFFVADPMAELHARYVTIAGAKRGIEAIGGECRLDHVTLRGNGVGLDSRSLADVAAVQCRFESNRLGAILASAFALRQCAFVDNLTGLRITGEGGAVDRNLFDNAQYDIVKDTRGPLLADGNIFHTGDPATIYDRLMGHVLVRRITVGRTFGRRYATIQPEPFAEAVARGDRMASEYQWEKALEAYKEALLGLRDRDVFAKCLKMFKQLVETEGDAALEREIEFCRSAVLVYPGDIGLLSTLAELYYRLGRAKEGRAMAQAILRIDPANEYAKKRLEGRVAAP